MKDVNRKQRRGVLTLLLVLTFGCGGSPSEPSPLPIGEPFELRPGSTATLAGDVFVSFLRVQSDSRCPMDAICVTAGEAVVAVSLRTSAGIPTENRIIGPPVCDIAGMRAECFLSTAAGKSAATAGRYTIELRQLAPYPRASSPIRPGDYVATFAVLAR